MKRIIITILFLGKCTFIRQVNPFSTFFPKIPHFQIKLIDSNNVIYSKNNQSIKVNLTTFQEEELALKYFIRKKGKWNTPILGKNISWAYTKGNIILAWHKKHVYRLISKEKWKLNLKRRFLSTFFSQYKNSLRPKVFGLFFRSNFNLNEICLEDSKYLGSVYLIVGKNSSQKIAFYNFNTHNKARIKFATLSEKGTLINLIGDRIKADFIFLSGNYYYQYDKQIFRFSHFTKEELLKEAFRIENSI